MSLNHYDRRLVEIEQLIKSVQYCACIRECGSVFETGLRDLVQHLIQESEDAGKRNEILAAERKIAKGGESFKKFGLGQLVGLYAEAKIFDQLRTMLKTPLSKVKRISWNDVVSLRNQATHDELAAGYDEGDALQMYFWLKVFLYETNLAGNAKVLKAKEDVSLLTGESCPACKASLQKEWKFCPECGTCIHLICAGCGEKLGPKFKICPYCETRLRGTTPAGFKAEQEYEAHFRGAYLDKHVNEHEREALEQKRLELGLSTDEAEAIESRCIPRNEAEYHRLVEGVYVDGLVNEAERAFLNLKMEQLKIDSRTATLIERSVRRSREMKSNLKS